MKTLLFFNMFSSFGYKTWLLLPWRRVSGQCGCGNARPGRKTAERSQAFSKLFSFLLMHSDILNVAMNELRTLWLLSQQRVSRCLCSEYKTAVVNFQTHNGLYVRGIIWEAFHSQAQIDFRHGKLVKPAQTGRWIHQKTPCQRTTAVGSSTRLLIRKRSRRNKERKPSLPPLLLKIKVNTL